MLLSEFARKLDRLFEIERFAEPNGWDFALGESEKTALLRRAAPDFARTFNGLLLGAGRGDSAVARAHLLVFPEASLIDQVLARESDRGGGAVIVTHHPVDMETGGRGFVAIPERQLQGLEQAKVAFYVLHAALDCHNEISTSRALAEGLGLEITDVFAPYVGGEAGVIGNQPPEPFADFAERVRALCELPYFRMDQVRFAGRAVSRVAVVAGGGDDPDYLAEAEAKGADCYLAGHWWTPHPGEWCDHNRAALRDAIALSRMNLLSASHDGSELVVFRDRLEPLFESWELAVELHRQTDHWR
jgi:putative NIF3 family GTP cyclohydrolase 1 type 2